MSKHKEKSKAKARKSSQLVLRVEKPMKEAFIAVCESLDSSAGREVRRFMQDFIASHTLAEPDAPAAAPEPDAAPEPGTAPEPDTAPQTSELPVKNPKAAVTAK